MTLRSIRRGWCSECPLGIRIRNDGVIARHRVPRGYGEDGKVCPGSGRSPEKNDDRFINHPYTDSKVTFADGLKADACMDITATNNGPRVCGWPRSVHFR